MSNRLSLPAALLVNLNIMLGSGVFINTVLLSQAAGGASGGAYLLGGLCILPLIVILARLMRTRGGGTFYDFGASIHPLIGFIASWGYFTAKLASAALSIHVFVTLTQLLIPALGSLDALHIDSVLIALFVLLNLMNVRIGTLVQYGFLSIKMIPIFLMIIGACIVGGFDIFGTITLDQVLALGTTLPFVLFALSGFEASCSLSQSLDNPEKNGPRAIWGSYIVALTLLVAYQCTAYLLIAPGLTSIPSFREAFPFAALRIGGDALLAKLLTAAFFIGIAPSALGASYGILFSNGWNLHALMQAHSLPGATLFLTRNRHGIPFLCFLAEGSIALIYLWLFRGAQIPLQHISALGSAGAYGISSLAYLYACNINENRAIMWALAGILSVCIMIGFTIKSALICGPAGIITHALVLSMGTLLTYCYTRSS